MFKRKGAFFLYFTVLVLIYNNLGNVMAESSITARIRELEAGILRTEESLKHTITLLDTGASDRGRGGFSNRDLAGAAALPPRRRHGRIKAKGRPQVKRLSLL